MRSRIVCLCYVLAVICLLAGAFVEEIYALIEKLSVEDLTNRSSLILIGKVTDMRSE